MLRKKMIRDIRKNVSQYITIFLMILIGIFAYTGIEAYMLGMEKSADNYYNKNNLEDFNVYGEFSNKDIEKVKKIYNVDDVNGKLTLPSLGFNKDNNHKYTINFIKENTVSKFYIIDGIEFDINNNGIWLDYYYAKENKPDRGLSIARMVGHILRYMPGAEKLPCHRVVNMEGRTAPGWSLNRPLLEKEGVTFKPNGHVDMQKHLWEP